MDVFSFTQGRRIHLVDTPGFNDTDRSDIETLGILATYLGASYANGVRIHGIIMLHPILDNRMPGWSMRNIEMMKAMCGFSSYDTVAIATTMCPDAQSSYDRVGLEQREDELLTEYRFLGGLVAQGATMFRHNDKGCRGTFEENVSAQRIVSFLTQQSDMHAPYILQLQRERINEGKTLGETAAGIVVAGDLYKAPREHERQLRATEKALKEQELHDMEESMREIRDDMSWRSLTPNRKKQAAQELKEHEGIVNSARQELTEVRDARDEFSRQTGNIVNGIINGISSGVATGVITAGEFHLSD
ncbi:hypothetical protein BJX99DRAFT_255766 [Aspergillus californicus]